MKRIVTLTALIMSGLVGTIVGGQAAAGTEPQVVIFEDQGFFALPDLNCNGFKLLYTMFDERVTEITFFDDQGNPFAHPTSSRSPGSSPTRRPARRSGTTRPVTGSST